MNDSFQKHSQAWVSFSYISFAAAAFMLFVGLYMMPIDLWGKGYLAMGILMLVQTTVNVTSRGKGCVGSRPIGVTRGATSWRK